MLFPFQRAAGIAFLGSLACYAQPVIDTVAGGGSSLGDGGPALAALIGPSGVAVDRAGNVYIFPTPRTFASVK